MPYLGYLLAQAVKAGQTVASAITSATNYVTRVGSSVVELSASAEVLKSPSNGSAVFGGSDYVAIPFNSAMASTGAISVFGWFQRVDWQSTTGVRFVSKTESGGYHICANEGSNVPSGNTGVLVYISGAYRVAYVANSTIPSGWNYIGFTFDGQYVRFYVNGNNVSTYNHGSQSTIGYTFDNAFIIGGEASSSATTAAAGDRLIGNSSNVAVWSRALSAEEVRSVMMKSYDDLNASETKGLVSWYALDDISGTTVPDSHGNFNGTAY